MDTTVVLSRAIGLFLIVAGAALALRRHAFIPVLAGLVEQRVVRTVAALAELLAALLLLVMHNEWSSPPAALVSAFGWMAVGEAAAYLVLPDDLLGRLIARVNRPGWYVAGGVGALAVGAYLAGSGFGVF